MKYTFGHYSIVLDPDYRYERKVTETQHDCNIALGYDEDYFITFFDEINGGEITYNKATITDEEAKEILNSESDEDMIEIAKDQKKESEEKLADVESRLKIALLPQDPNDDKNIFLEIRPAAG